MQWFLWFDFVNPQLLLLEMFIIRKKWIIIMISADLPLQSPSDWLASVSIIPLSPGDQGCSSEPTGSKTLILPGNSR